MIRPALQFPRPVSGFLRAHPWLMFLLLARGAGAQEFEPRSASLDDLVYQAVRYATTPGKRARQAAARDELAARGPDALRALMERIHIENVMIAVLAEQQAERMGAEAGAPVLAEFLGATHSRTRKMAAYFLGDYRAPEYADRMEPLLDDEQTAGVAIRALGKWQVAEAGARIALFLHHPRERWRVFAANALRDIGDPRAIPPLIEALSDPVFTVRQAAARALVSFGADAEPALRNARSGAPPPARRLIDQALSALDN
jgi:HEAT repeat protein